MIYSQIWKVTYTMKSSISPVLDMFVVADDIQGALSVSLMKLEERSESLEPTIVRLEFVDFVHMANSLVETRS